MRTKKDYSEAKRMFEWYQGSKFHMLRDGSYETYKAFDVPNGMEAIWIKEMIGKERKIILTARNNREMTEGFERMVAICGTGNRRKDIYALFRFVEDRKGHLDTNSMLRMTYALESTLHMEKDQQRKQELENRIYDILKYAGNHPISVDDAYFEDGAIPDYLEESRMKTEIDKKLALFGRRDV